MMKKVILYTMQGCPHCEQIREILMENNIEFIDRDIHKFEKEYDKFVEATENEFIPAFLLFESDGKITKNVQLLVPDRDFGDINEAVDKIKSYLD